MLKAPAWDAEALDGVTISGIWVRYGEDIEEPADEYTLDLNSELWTNDWCARKENEDGSVTLTIEQGEEFWQAGEFGFAVPRDKAGNTHPYKKVVIKYRDADLTDASPQCGYVMHMGDETKVDWVDGEESHPETLVFNGTGETVIDVAETTSGISERNFSTLRIFGGKVGGKITIESITLAKEYRPAVDTDVELTNANSSPHYTENLFESDYTTPAGADVENEDGSISFYTTAMHSGNGLDFYLNKDKSHFDMTKYSKIQITLSAEQDEVPLYLALVTDGKVPSSWDPEVKEFQTLGADLEELYPVTAGAGEKHVYEIDLTNKEIPQDTDKGADCGVTMLRIKYNGYMENDERTDEEKMETKAGITVWSIKFVENTPEPTPDPYVPEGEGWKKLDLSQLEGDADGYVKAGDRLVLNEGELGTIPLPEEPVVEAAGQEVEVLIRGSFTEESSGFRFWLANEFNETLSTQYFLTDEGVGICDDRDNYPDSRPQEDPDGIFKPGQPFQIQTVLEHVNWDNSQDTLARRLLIKQPNMEKSLNGITITGIWVRYGDKIGTTVEPVENTDVELTTANSLIHGVLFESDYTTPADAGVENKDGSISFYSTAKYNNGGGLEFYLNKDKSHFDMTKYSKIQVTLSAEQDEIPLCLELVTDGKAPASWDPSVEVLQTLDADLEEEYPFTGRAGEKRVYEIDLTNKEIPQNTDKGADCGVTMLRIKYNGYVENDERTEEEQMATKAGITISSIKFVE